jgi:hypothetical protein
MEKSPEKTNKEGENIEGKKSPEELNLEQVRNSYVNAYIDCRKFNRGREKEFPNLDKKIESAREFIHIGDSERFTGTKGVNEEGDARDRRKNFVTKLGIGTGDGTAEMIYETELKKAEYEAVKIEAGKKMLAEGVPQAEIFKKLILEERGLLDQAKVEAWPPKEKGIFRKGMEWYMKRGTVTRLLISTGLATGVVTAAGGFSVPALAIFAGQRFVRGFGSVTIGKLAGMGVDWVMSKGINAQKEASLSELKKSFDLNKLKEIEQSYQKILEETAKKERRKLLIKGAVTVAVGAGTAIGLGMIEKSWGGEIKKAVLGTAEKPSGHAPVAEKIYNAKPGIKIEAIKPEMVSIGNRGPEGSIIDYFKTHSEAAKNFGWDGKADISKWAGEKAHQLWLEDAGKALKNPEILDKLEKLNYSKNLQGYTEMMHRIGKGAVEIDPKAGKINLIDTDYLRAKISIYETGARVEVPVEEIPKISIPDQWKTVQSYQWDIDQMRSNLGKYSDPGVKASVETEISRIEHLRDSVIKNIAEHTKQQPIVEGIVAKAEAVKTIKESLMGLSVEKHNFFDSVISSDVRNSFKLNAIIHGIKEQKIIPEDFAKYYAGRIGAQEVSEEMMGNLKSNFKAIIEGNTSDRLNAERAMTVIIQRLANKKFGINE